MCRRRSGFLRGPLPSLSLPSHLARPVHRPGASGRGQVGRGGHAQAGGPPGHALRRHRGFVGGRGRGRARGRGRVGLLGPCTVVAPPALARLSAVLLAQRPGWRSRRRPSIHLSLRPARPGRRGRARRGRRARLGRQRDDGQAARAGDAAPERGARHCACVCVDVQCVGTHTQASQPQGAGVSRTSPGHGGHSFSSFFLLREDQTCEPAPACPLASVVVVVFLFREAITRRAPSHAAHSTMAAAPKRPDYDHLVKLLLIGDSGESEAGAKRERESSSRPMPAPLSLTPSPLPSRRRQVLPPPAVCGGPVHVQLHHHDRVRKRRREGERVEREGGVSWGGRSGGARRILFRSSTTSPHPSSTPPPTRGPSRPCLPPLSPPPPTLAPPPPPPPTVSTSKSRRCSWTAPGPSSRSGTRRARSGFARSRPPTTGARAGCCWCTTWGTRPPSRPCATGCGASTSTRRLGWSR